MYRGFIQMTLRSPIAKIADRRIIHTRFRIPIAQIVDIGNIADIATIANNNGAPLSAGCFIGTSLNSERRR